MKLQQKYDELIRTARSAGIQNLQVREHENVLDPVIRSGDGNVIVKRCRRSDRATPAAGARAALRTAPPLIDIASPL